MNIVYAFVREQRWWWCVVTAAVLCGCRDGSPNVEPVDGKILAAVACVRCHELPSPAFLSPEEWPYMLEWMGSYLGHPAEIELHPVLVNTNLVPPQPLVTRAQFDAIRQYFLDESAVQFSQPELALKPPASQLFDPLPMAVPASVVSMVAIDSTDQTLLVGSSNPPGLLVLQRGLTKTIEVPSEPVTYERLGSVRRLALLGHLGHDARMGRVFDFDVDREIQRIHVDEHPRIVAHRTADVDGDGSDDLFVCGFGEFPAGRGGIWWGGKSVLEEQVLFEEPGAVWGDLADFDGDGDGDVVVAFANTRPSISAFVNEGDRHFKRRVLVQRRVGWGYNRGAICDWDGDSRPDLIEIAGNNLELRGRPVKANHGVRVLRNEGGWKFSEVLFEPLPGAMDVVTGDFDGNGRMDVALTAFYPDWRSPAPTTFLLLLQQPDGGVERTGIDDRFWNRWMRVGVGDADGDGDTDLLLGAAAVPMAIPAEHGSRYQTLLQGKASVLLLRNRTVP